MHGKKVKEGFMNSIKIKLNGSIEEVGPGRAVTFFSFSNV